MKYIFLSPHFDDAIGSCGGFISRLKNLNNEVLIVTCFAQPISGPFSNFANELHNMWNLTKPVEERTVENNNACRCLQVNCRNLPFIEAIYRISNDRFLYPLADDIFKDIADEDYKLIDKIAKELIKIFSKEDVIYSPVAIGNHVDHLLVNAAAKKLKSLGYNIKFYRDFSYYGYVTTLSEYRSYNVVLTEEEIDKKIKAVKMYKSQLNMLFKGKIYEYYKNELEGKEEYYE